MERKKVFKRTNLNEFVKLFWLYISSKTTTKIGAARNNMRLERPCTGSANPRAHSDPVLAMRRIARNVFLKERGSLYEKN